MIVVIVERFAVSRGDTVPHMDFVKRQTTFNNESLFATDKRQTKLNILQHLGI